MAVEMDGEEAFSLLLVVAPTLTALLGTKPAVLVQATLPLDEDEPDAGPRQSTPVYALWAELSAAARAKAARISTVSQLLKYAVAMLGLFLLLSQSGLVTDHGFTMPTSRNATTAEWTMTRGYAIVCALAATPALLLWLLHRFLADDAHRALGDLATDWRGRFRAHGFSLGLSAVPQAGGRLGYALLATPAAAPAHRLSGGQLLLWDAWTARWALAAPEPVFIRGWYACPYPPQPLDPTADAALYSSLRTAAQGGTRGRDGLAAVLGGLISLCTAALCLALVAGALLRSGGRRWALVLALCAASLVAVLGARLAGRARLRGQEKAVAACKEAAARLGSAALAAGYRLEVVAGTAGGAAAAGRAPLQVRLSAVKVGADGAPQMASGGAEAGQAAAAGEAGGRGRVGKDAAKPREATARRANTATATATGRTTALMV